MKSSKIKKALVLTIESPLILICLILKICIAVLYVINLRVLGKGLEYGKKLNNYLDYHEKGLRK